MPEEIRLGPTAEGERIVALDALRGFALAGIFVVNIAFFSLPLMRAIYDASLPEGPVADRLAWAFVAVFGEYKFISMFSLLFGMGFALQGMRADTRGRPFAGVFIRRLLVLGVIGLLHAHLLWYGDILFVYAIAGLVLLPLRRVAPRTVLLLAVVALVLVVFQSTGWNALVAMFGKPPVMTIPDPLPTGWEAIATFRDPNQEGWALAETVAYAEGPFLDALAFRVASWFGMIFAFLMMGMCWRVLGMFLLGAALMRLRFFDPDRAAWHRRMMIVGLGVGLPLEAGAAAIRYATAFEPGWGMPAAALLHEAGGTVLCLGYVGLGCRVVASGRLALLVKALANAGRLSLSVYLMETILATAVMYWWGLGLFGSVPRHQQLGLVVLIYGTLVVAASLWLRAFRIGPFEWLWRAITYGRLPKLRR